MPAKRSTKKTAKRKPAAPRKRRDYDPADPHWIPRIHDYCDRWCERCEFSHRCFRFAVTERILGPKAGGQRSALDALTRMFAESRHDLTRLSDPAGKDTDERRVAAQVAAEKRIQRKAMISGARETKAAHTYLRMVDEWFNNEIMLALSHVRTLEQRVRKGLVPMAEAKGYLVRMNDSVEVIRWHQHLPYVKLCRAFTSRVEEEAAGEKTGQLDSNGSAKTALISIDQSIDAWTQFSGFLPDHANSILEILIRLDRLRRAIVRRFPRARRFKRPGFDEKTRRTKAPAKSPKKPK